MNDSEPLPCSDKLVFESRKDALTTATVTMFQRGIKLKAYRCKHCNLWHLASA